MHKVTPSQFMQQIASLGVSLRRKIEAEVSSFNPDISAQKARVKQVQDSEKGFRFFVETYFPHYITSSPNLLHLHLFERLPLMLVSNQKGKKGARLCEVAPRGSAKSTLVSQLFILYCLILNKKRFILLGMDSYEQAALMLEGIKIELTDNPRLLMDFPAETGQGRMWREGEFITANHSMVQAVGSRMKVRGRRHGAFRPDLVILDDIENDENVRSPDYRNKLEQWVLKAVEPLGPPDGSMDMILLGTLLHFDAVLARISKMRSWEAHHFKAVVTYPDNMDLWDIFSQIALNEGEEEALAYHALNAKAMNKGAVVFWEAMKPIEQLMLIRALTPDAYQSEYQNEPFAQNAAFRDFTFYAKPQANMVIFGAIDPSLGKKGKGDPSAIVIGGLDPTTGRMDVLCASIRRRLPDVQISEIIALQREFKCSLWFVEAVQFQEFFRTTLMVKAALEGLSLPCVPVTPITDKLLRIERLQPPIKDGLIRFHSSQSVLLDQFRQFPNAAHDDGPDCLEMLWSNALTYGGGGFTGGNIRTTSKAFGRQINPMEGYL
jgi:predicted phage terminase large subunit-like protein